MAESRPGSAPPELRVASPGSASELERAAVHLDAAEAATGVPLVDEAERERLRLSVTDETWPSARWRPLLAERQGVLVGYAAVVLPDGSGDLAVGDLALLGADPHDREVMNRLLGELAGMARGASGRLQVWVRHVTPADLAGVEDQGFAVARRLAVLGRDLDEEIRVPTAGDLTVRASRPGEDDDAIVAVLAAAYAGTDDGGWTRERFAEKRSLPWFRAQDLLVAETSDGRILGLHWLKRREATVGEVYNLAVHPEGQGRRLGSLLLMAGLRHLRAVGCGRVLLWVDRANERAVRLYTGSGFVTQWDDVALECPSPDHSMSGSSSLARSRLPGGTSL